MNASQNMKPVSSIEQQLQSVNMSQRVRKAALHDASIAGMIVDAIVWVCGEAPQQRADVFANPNLNF